jgi:hypothetical protein
LKVERAKKVDQYTEKQKAYVIELRKQEPNMGYKRFYNKHLNPEEMSKYKASF